MAIESQESNIPESPNFKVPQPTLNIPETSGSVKAAIKSKSVENMPNNPSEMGWKAGDIKKRFYAPIYDDENSVLAEINRVIKVINEAYTKALITYIQEIETAAAKSDAGKVDKISGSGFLYGVDDKGYPSIRFSSEKLAWYIARYNKGGTFKVADPIDEDDATPKSYVRDLVKNLIKEVKFEKSEEGTDVFNLTITTEDGKSTTTAVDLNLESLVTEVDDFKGEDGKYYLKLTFQNGETKTYLLDEIFAGVNDLLDDIKATINEQGEALAEKVDRISYGAASVIKGDTAVYAVDENNKPKLLPVKLNPGTYTVVRRDAAGHVIVPDLKENSPIDAAINKKDMQKLGTSLTNKINAKGEEVKTYTDEQITEAKQYSDNNLAPVENRVSALENTLLTLERDTSVAYAKAVPANTYPKAFINSIGGMTYRKVADNLFPCPEEGITRIVEPMIGFGEVYLPAGTYSYSVDATYEYEEEDRFSYLGFMSNPDNATDPTGYVELSTPFTLTETTKVYLIGIKEGAYMGGNVTVKVMLNDGSTVKAFSAYFPPYLEDTKATEVISHGANLLDLSKAVNQNFVDNGDGTYTFTRTSADPSGRFSAIFPLKIPAGVSIAFCGEGSNDINVSLQFLTETSEPTSTTVNFNGAVFLRTFTEAVAKARLYLSSSAAVGDSCTIAKVRINIGSSILPYTLYREPIHYPIPAEIQAQMSGKGILDIKNNNKYLDTVNFDSGKCEYNANNIILNGTENWKSEIRNSGKKDLNFYMDDPIGKPFTPVVCNYFESVVGRSTGMDNNMWISGTGKLNCTAVGFASVDEWKAHLARLSASGNPVIVTYAVAEPTEEALAAEFDKKIDVFAGGYLEFVNDKGNAVPSDVAFIVSK